VCCVKSAFGPFSTSECQKAAGNIITFPSLKRLVIGCPELIFER